VKAIEHMLAETDRPDAPWTLVEAENKRWARVKVVETVVAALEDGLRLHGVLIDSAD
jgi:AMP-polyphosphate phosphotransferase